MILQPGLHYDVPEDAYHRDPAPEPSLSSSVAKILIEQSPRHAWHAHPRLGGTKEERDNTRAMEIGTVVHKLLLGRGKQIEIIEADDYRSKAAKDAREAAYAAGQQPILRVDHRTACATVAAVSDQLDKVDGCSGFGVHGAAEVVGVWHDMTGVYGRSMMDWLQDDGTSAIVFDVKTTSQSAAPHAVARTITSMNYELSAAFYERGLLHLRPELAGRIKFRWIFCEVEPPHLVTVAELDNVGLEIGRKKVAAAFNLWSRCLRENVWPGYPARIVVPSYPSWAETAWLEREVRDEDLVARGGDPFLDLAPWVPPAPPKAVVEAV